MTWIYTQAVAKPSHPGSNVPSPWQLPDAGGGGQASAPHLSLQPRHTCWYQSITAPMSKAEGGKDFCQRHLPGYKYF